MTQIKSARKIIPTSVSVEIKSIRFDSNKMSNTLSWETNNPQNEEIISFDVIIFENDTSGKRGNLKKTIEFSPSTKTYTHRNVQIISQQHNYFQTYSYQIVAYTRLSSVASKIEKFDPREIYEIESPKQITYSIRNDKVYFFISCNENKFATNIFIFRRNFNDDVFTRIGVIQYRRECSFTDSDVYLGQFYEYRFISYDLFQHFSQKIVKIDIFVWDKNYESSRTNMLYDPIPIAEYAKESSNKQFIKLKVSNIDPKCLLYFVKRRDLSEKREKFSEPEQWNGSNSLINFGSTELTFVDSIIRSDSYYQYSVFGVDKFANETDVRQSNIVFTEAAQNLPASPINISGEIINEYPTGVRLEWSDDNRNRTLASVISGSSDLFPKDNLFYFKVFRRRADELNYESFPEQSSSFIVDPCSNDGEVIKTQYPYYQPSPPMRDLKYYYYVATYDASTNVRSNRSKEILVDLTVPPAEIIDLKSFFDKTFEPLKCVLTWKESENEKTLDSFTVERLEENKTWQKIGKSYFNTQYVDSTIERNKKYLYRVRAVDFNNNMSKWSLILVDTH